MNKLYARTFLFVALGYSASMLANDINKVDISAGEKTAQSCVACHGPQGNSVMPFWPKLAGQGARYVEQQLNAFKAGQRKNDLMTPMAEKLTEQDIRNVAAYFASQTVTTGEAKADLVEHGEAIYKGGDRERGIPACTACHGPTGSGNPAAAYPSLKGQHMSYTENQLQSFRDEQRENIIMRDIAAKMRPSDMKAVSSYIEGLH